MTDIKLTLEWPNLVCLLPNWTRMLPGEEWDEVCGQQLGDFTYAWHVLVQKSCSALTRQG